LPVIMTEVKQVSLQRRKTLI